MKLSMKRYSFLLCLQFSFLIADLFFNTFAQLLVRDRLELTILLYVTQDAFIICEYLFFNFAVHSTCVYEVSASHVILRNCKFFLFTILTYFLLSASQHFLIVYNTMWSPPGTPNWPGTLMALSCIQRWVSFMYYYTYKRTALSLSDPHYDDIDWIAEQLTNK